MRLSSPERRRPPISLTPLIDVVFLLLIFFMLASTFLKFAGSAVSGASGGGTADTIRELALIQVRGKDTLTVNGQPVAIDALGAQLTTISRQGITRGVIRPLPGANVQDLVTVLEIARGAPLKSVVVVK